MLSAQDSADHVPALGYHWDFGDGTGADGMAVTHTFTHAANYTIHLRGEGIEGVPFEKDYPVAVTGTVEYNFSAGALSALPGKKPWSSAPVRLKAAGSVSCARILRLPSVLRVREALDCAQDDKTRSNQN